MTQVEKQMLVDRINLSPNKALEALYPQGRDKLGKSAIGKVMAGLLYDSDETRQLREKAKTTLLTSKERQKGQEYSLSLVMGMVGPSDKKLKTIASKMQSDDVRYMRDLIDLVRVKSVRGTKVARNSPQAINTEINGRYVAEGMGFSPDMKNGQLAKLFDRVLTLSQAR